jgi:hypothetical protein
MDASLQTLQLDQLDDTIAYLESNATLGGGCSATVANVAAAVAALVKVGFGRCWLVGKRLSEAVTDPYVFSDFLLCREPAAEAATDGDTRVSMYERMTCASLLSTDG